MDGWRGYSVRPTMNPSLLINGLGSVGFFSTRIFLPALLTAIVIRFGAQIPVLGHYAPLIQHIHGHPTWFTSDASIAILTALSILEFLAQKNPDARRLMHEFDAGAKGFMALLTALGVASATDTKFVNDTMHQSGFSLHIAAIIAAIGTVGVARVRGAALAALHEIDPDDAMRLQHLISWAEDVWVLVGMLLFFLSPVLMLCLIACVIGLLMMVRRHLESIEEHTRTPCVQCGTSIYPSACACFRCKTPVASPRALGVLGQSKSDPDPDPANHVFHLIQKKRCPVCATHLKQRTPHQTCGTCGTMLFAGTSTSPSAEQYTSFVSSRLPITLGVSTALSLVPLVGLLVGTIYYQFALVYPFTGYLPFGRRFILKWGIRILFVVLFFFQLLPGIGAVVVPTMALICFLAYRSAFTAAAATTPESAMEPMPPGETIAGAPAV
jgi:hypothetical protein